MKESNQVEVLLQKTAEASVVREVSKTFDEDRHQGAFNEKLLDDNLLGPDVIFQREGLDQVLQRC